MQTKKRTKYEHQKFAKGFIGVTLLLSALSARTTYADAIGMDRSGVVYAVMTKQRGRVYEARVVRRHQPGSPITFIGISSEFSYCLLEFPTNFKARVIG